MSSTSLANASRAGASRLIVLTCAFVLALAVTCAPASAFEKAFWGPAAVNGVSQFPRYQELGVTLYQVQLLWHNVAPHRPKRQLDPQDPAYRWPARLDAVIRQARLHGMDVLIMIIGSPRWANGGRSWTHASAPAPYARFARAASRRYRTVRRWMIWGEPSNRRRFKPFTNQRSGTRLTAKQARTPRRYARLLDAAYGQLKARTRKNIVIGGNSYTTGSIRPVDWVRHLRLTNGKPPRMDEYGHNPFTRREPDFGNPQSLDGVVDFSDLRRFNRLVQSRLGRPRHKRLKLFLSEYTIPTAALDREFNFWVDLDTQAKWIRSGFREARKLKSVSGLGWIHLYDDPPDPGGALGSHSGLLTYDGQKKPGYRAFLEG